VAQLLNEMNADLMPYMTPNHMNTALCYVRLEPGGAGHYTAHIANAGMVAPILRRGIQCQYLNIGGVPLGMAEAGSLYRALELPLQQGDILVLSSDGIVEARNAANEMYGFERLLARVHDAPGRNAREIHEWILSDVRSFVDNVEQHDDMTLMAVLIRENLPDVPVSQE